MGANMKKQFYFLSGMPRAGSTLLCSLLAQNPEVHTEGTSGLAQFMWENQSVRYRAAYQFLAANNKDNIAKDIIKALPDLYYANAKRSKVIDKCRPWPLPDNLRMIYEYITDTPKILVLVRPVAEILKSFLYLHQQNNSLTEQTLNNYITPRSDPIMRSHEAVVNAKYLNNPDMFLFITYEDIVKRTKETLAKIYEFFGWESFDHDLSNIVNSAAEDDSVYGLIGQHDVRPTISTRDINIALPDHVLALCEVMDRQMGL